MKIAVVGTGYVGLVTGTCFAEAGHAVTCLDLDASKIETLRGGGVPIYEPGLEELVRRNVKERRLAFTTSYAEGIPGADIVFIAVGTPPGENGDADLSHVLAAARDIGRALTGYAVVVNKSTVPVGSAERVAEILRGVAVHPFDVVSNPEFLKEGAAIDDFMRPDRVVVGVASERARAVMNDLYAPFVRAEQPILFMNLRSAELTKYAANAMLATRISFMNEMAALCEKLGADVDQVRRGVGSDRRIGHPFLFPGVGYGGSCFPKDVKALIATGRGAGVELSVLKAVEAANERQKQVLADKVVARFGEDLQGRQFAVWGLAFKANTDDMREAPSRVLIPELVRRGAVVRAYDPVAMPVARQLLRDTPGVTFADNPTQALVGCDALIIVTDWKEFRSPDFDSIKSLLREPVIIDGRNLYDPQMVRALGIEYTGIGRSGAPALR